MGEARTIHSLYAIGDLSSSLLPVVYSACISLSLLSRVRAREYGTRSFIIACVTNRLSPVTDIGEISRQFSVRVRRVSLVMFPRETTDHLIETPTNVFVRTSAKLRVKRTRFKRAGNTEQIALYFLAIRSIKHATCMREEILETIASLIWSDS